MMEDQHADEHIQELGRLYDLLARVNSLDRLRLYFGNYIKVTQLIYLTIYEFVATQHIK